MDCQNNVPAKKKKIIKSTFLYFYNLYVYPWFQNGEYSNYSGKIPILNVKIP